MGGVAVGQSLKSRVSHQAIPALAPQLILAHKHHTHEVPPRLPAPGRSTSQSKTSPLPPPNPKEMPFQKFTTITKCPKEATRVKSRHRKRRGRTSGMIRHFLVQVHFLNLADLKL